MNNKILLVPLFLCILSILTGASDKAFVQFQNNADIIRLRHLKYYNDLIEEYHQKTGEYPFQSADLATPTYVYIANSDQQQFTKPGPPFSHHEIPLKTFVQQVEKGVGHDILEFYDPQAKPDKKPNFYIYLIRGDTYYLSVQLFNSFPFTRQVAPGYNKIELSNHPSIDNKAVLPRRLFNNQEYKAEVLKEVQKPEFFMAKEAKYIHDSKQTVIK